MAEKLGRLFLNAALGPIAYAGRCMMARKVKAGLEDLSAESLMGSLQRGVETVAKEVGLPPAYVTALLPADELHALIDRIHKNQMTCVKQWDLHTGHIGGLLDGVADLTVDRRPPDVGLCLVRLSRKMQMDRVLSEPLRDLSENIDQWRDLLLRCRTIIDDGKSLKTAYRKRRILYGVAIAAVALLCVIGLSIGGVYYMARQRVDTLLAAADGCAVENVDESDLRKASSDQLALIESKKEQCEDNRRKVRAKAKAEREKKKREAEATRKRDERQRTCKQLADALQSSTLTRAALAAAPEQSDFIKRLFMRKLTTEDVSAKLTLPCANTKAAEAVEVAYAQAVLKARPYWLGQHLLSEQAVAMLVKHKATLSQSEVVILSWASDDRAQKAVKRGVPETLQRAAQLCKLAKDLDLATQQPCRVAITMASKL